MFFLYKNTRIPISNKNDFHYCYVNFEKLGLEVKLCYIYVYKFIVMKKLLRTEIEDS